MNKYSAYITNITTKLLFVANKNIRGKVGSLMSLLISKFNDYKAFSFELELTIPFLDMAKACFFIDLFLF